MKKKWTMFTMSAASALLVTSVASTGAIAAEPTFKDVPANHTFFNEIEQLAALGVVNGVGNGNFEPNGNVTRGQFAKMLVKALDLKASNLAKFNDVPEDHIFYKEIGTLAALNISIGDGQGKFNPNNKVTREEIALFISRALQLTSNGENPFEDVDKNVKQIVALVEKEIIKGKTDKTFDPKGDATRGQAAALIARALIYQETRPFALNIMHVNDLHANVDKYPKLYSAIKEQRIQKRDSLLLNAGDVFSGTLYFNVFNGEADMTLLNLMNFDVMTFGNHEFDLGSSAEGHKKLQQFVTGSNYPFLGTNVNFKADANLKDLQKRFVTTKPENGKIYDAIIKTVNGEKVGIFSLTTEETTDISSANDVKFENYVERAKDTVEALENLGVNKIIALTHIGYDDNALVDNDLELAKIVDGIDIIVGGHSHTQLNKPVVVNKNSEGEAKDPTIIVQAYQYADYLGTVSVEFDENGVLTSYDGELIATANYADDPTALKALKPYKTGIEEFSKQEIGVESKVTLENPRLSTHPVSVRANETALGNLVTDGMLWKARQVNEDKNLGKSIVLAVQNGGGIRAEIKAGQITEGDIKTVLPFANTLAIVDLTGKQIKEMFEHSVRLVPEENGGFLHVAGGKVTFDSSKPAGDRVEKIEYLNEDGEYVEIDLTDEEILYTLATNAFTVKGGDGFSMLLQAYEANRATDLGLVDSDNFREYLLHLGEVNEENAKIEGRILDKKPPVVSE